MSNGTWELRQTPHRAYWYTPPGGKPSWTIKGVGRIASVTQVLDAASGGLTSWAAAQATAASEQVARDWLGAEAPLAQSVLSFGELAALQPEWPDNVRDAKGDSGTALHHYLHARLSPLENTYYPAPYGLRCGVDAFMDQHQPLAVYDAEGEFYVERAVGDLQRAVAGTPDALLDLGGRVPEFHLVDLKQSNTVKPTFFAQLAAYHRCAQMSGWPAADFLTILHVDGAGNYKLHSIPANGPDATMALDLFDAYLAIHRMTPKLARLLK
jgi:hypothetical protein